MSKKSEQTPLEKARALWSKHRPQSGSGARRMVYNYVPKWLGSAMPKLYSQDGENDPVVWLKLFSPTGRWTFYATEYSETAPDGTPDLFFGYLLSPLGSDCDEMCYMTLEQVKELRGAGLRLPVERDLWWTPKPLSEVKATLDGMDEPTPDPTPKPKPEQSDRLVGPHQLARAGRFQSGIPMSEIALSSEGKDDATVTTWEAAAEYLIAVWNARFSKDPEPGWYHKTWFTITYEDGESYEGGRIDVGDSAGEIDIGQHIAAWRDYCTGLCKPDHLSQAEYDRYVADYRQDGTAQAIDDFCREYEIVEFRIEPVDLGPTPPAPPEPGVRSTDACSMQGEPCTVVVEKGEHRYTITSAWLYRQWQVFNGAIREDHPDDEAHRDTFDAAARTMFLGGEMENKRAADFCRFCRVVIQTASFGKDRETWEKTYRDGGDFDPSPSWRKWLPYLGHAVRTTLFALVPGRATYQYHSSPDTMLQATRYKDGGWGVHRRVDGEWKRLGDGSKRTISYPEMAQLLQVVVNRPVEFDQPVPEYQPQDLPYTVQLTDDPGITISSFGVAPREGGGIETYRLAPEKDEAAEMIASCQAVADAMPQIWLAFEDDGKTVSFSNDEYRIAAEYVDRGENRYSSGWKVYRKADGNWEIVEGEKPQNREEWQKSLTLDSAVCRLIELAGRVVRFEGKPDGLPDSYPYVSEDTLHSTRARDESESEEAVSALPKGWTAEDIRCLLDGVDRGAKILVSGAGESLGIPTIHNFDHQAKGDHIGMGVIKAKGPGYTIVFDAGQEMSRTPSGHGYTSVDVREGEFPYDVEGVRAKLEAWLQVTEQAEVLTRSEAETLLDEALDTENNPAQTLTTDLLDAAERVMKAEIVDDPESSATDDDIVCSRGGPIGSLTIVYLDDGTILWTGDVRCFAGHGEQQFRAAWQWLQEGKAKQTRLLSKSYYGNRHAESRRKLGEVDALRRVVQSCYAEPDIPEDWDNPGLHLAAHIRALLLRAYLGVQDRDGRVFYEGLAETFDELAKTDEVLGRIELTFSQLWSPDRWVASLDREVLKRKSWRYVATDERRLAKKLRGNRDALLEALSKATGKRENTILSELADLDRVPEEYIPADKAGKPAPAEVKEPEPETVALTSFDNGDQFGYDSDRFGIWGPYKDADGQRWTHGWTVWDNTRSDIPVPVRDEENCRDGAEANLGSWSLRDAVQMAEAHFCVQICVEGEQWDDEYPRYADWKGEPESEPPTGPRSPNYGDWVRAPDGEIVQMRGGGGMGSNRVKGYDRYGNQAGWYNRDDLAFVAETLTPEIEAEMDEFTYDKAKSIFEQMITSATEKEVEDMASGFGLSSTKFTVRFVTPEQNSSLYRRIYDIFYRYFEYRSLQERLETNPLLKRSARQLKRELKQLDKEIKTKRGAMDFAYDLVVNDHGERLAQVQREMDALLEKRQQVNDALVAREFRSELEAMPQPQPAEPTPIEEWDIGWETWNTDAGSTTCSRCQAKSKANEVYYRGWKENHQPVYLCPVCQSELHAWSEAQLQAKMAEEKARLREIGIKQIKKWQEIVAASSLDCKNPTKRCKEPPTRVATIREGDHAVEMTLCGQCCEQMREHARKGHYRFASRKIEPTTRHEPIIPKPTVADVAEYEGRWCLYFETGAVATVRKTVHEVASLGVLRVALDRIERGNPKTVEARRAAIQRRIKQLEKAA